MSEPLARYSFLPWLREGLANNITQADGADVKLRASVPIKLTVSSLKVDGSPAPDEDVDKAVELYGPGDIIGIDSKAIVKTEPRNWISNFEPNYLPYIDFYVEDFAWRYTPAKPDSNRLRPWITLVVLKEDEFEDGQNMKEKPLPYFRMKEGKKALEIFPDRTQLWAWAHVHVNTDLSNDAPLNAINDTQVNQAADDLIQKNPDHAYCRLLCPRKLEPNKAYHAFVIPTFESGRLAGLGTDIPADLNATTCGWENEANIEFPYYYRWYFVTGNVGDFEYLVNLLKPRKANKNVGVRDIDVVHPGSNLPPIDDPALQNVLKLGGALRVPVDTLEEPDKEEVEKYDLWDEPYPHRFITAMARRINLADDYVDPTRLIADANRDANVLAEPGQGDPDPVITSPLYGRWHALQQRLLLEKNESRMPHDKNWVHELNLDPRFRSAAGLGTKVIQKGQEEYMLAAWEQVGKVIEANNKLRMALLAKEAAGKFYEKHFASISREHLLFMTAAVQKRIVYKNVTLYQHREESIVPPALTSGTFRSLIKPRGVVMKKLNLDDKINASNLIARIDNGLVTVVPPKIDPPAAIKLSDLAKAAGPQGAPPFIISLLKQYKFFRYLPLILLFIALIIVLLFFATPAGWSILGVLAAAAIYAFRKLNQWATQLHQQEVVSQASQTPQAVDAYPKRPGFVISDPGSNITAPIGTTDSVEAVNFKQALKDAFSVVSVKFPQTPRKKLDYGTLAAHALKSIDPLVTFPKRIFGTIQIPDHIRANMVEDFGTIMAYPAIDVPMYKPLADMSSELFLPNINLIEENSITLLENNQKFIEAYMVGINHEMSREMLWREYPADLRGTSFRQFWDVSGFLQTDKTKENDREALYDIPPIHQWSRIDTTRTDPRDPTSPLKNELGQHNLRAAASGKTQLVLVVRGELLKKYPTTVVYAHKADWGKINNVKSTNAERVFMELTPEEEKNPPTDKLKTPLFSAKIEPDIYFFGFDLDDEEARGTLNPTSVTNDKPGWFFVLKEREGELRFGLDIEKTKAEDGTEIFLNWNHLSWKHVGTADGASITMGDAIVVNPTNSPGFDEYQPMEEDKQARWSRDTTSAELAYILYQVPVLVGVHASRMLPK